MESIKRKEGLYGITNPRCFQLPPPKPFTLKTCLYLQFSPLGLSLPSLMEELAALLLSWPWKLPLNSSKETHPKLQKGIFQPWEGFQSINTARPRIMYTWAHTVRTSGEVSFLQLYPKPGDPAEKSSFSVLMCFSVHTPPAFPFCTLPSSPPLLAFSPLWIGNGDSLCK